MKKRMIAMLLCLCVVTAFLPAAAVAEGTQTAAIQLGAGGIPGYDGINKKYNYIYFGSGAFGEPLPSESSPIKWRVLDNKTNLGGSGLFLLSDILLGTGNSGDVVFDNIRSTLSNEWDGSSAQAWCNDFEQNNLTPKELAAVVPINQDAYNYAADYSDPALVNEQVFFPSVGEVTTEAYGFKTYLTSSTTRVGKYSNFDAPWLLRSGYTTGAASQVARGGAVLPAYLNGKYAARPAFNLDKSAVCFISAATSGKGSGAVGAGALQAVADDTAVNEWKLTLKDSTRSAFTASLHAASSADVTPGGSVLIDYSGAVTGSGEYISAMLVNSSDKVLYYGNIANAAASATAQAITIPDGLAEGGYTLKIFNEKLHGGKLTDYASELQNIDITVTDTTAPILTAGAVDRPGDTAATVRFTSNEAGQYYYEIVEKDAPAPAIDTTGTGTPCDRSEQTITPTLTAGAKDIYIIVKDAAGNASSSAFKITIPAYVPPDTTAPILTAGAVARTSDSAATVKFTSNEAGQYYYEIVEKDAPAPTLITTGRGTPCGTTEQTIAAMMMAGAKDIYIVVKDAAGNVSSGDFKITIPAYVSLVPILTAGAVDRTGDTPPRYGSQATERGSITMRSQKRMRQLRRSIRRAWERLATRASKP